MKFLVLIFALTAFSAQATLTHEAYNLINRCSDVTGFKGAVLDFTANDSFASTYQQGLHNAIWATEELEKDYRKNSRQTNAEYVYLGITLSTKMQFDFLDASKMKRENEQTLDYIRCLQREIGR